MKLLNWFIWIGLTLCILTVKTSDACDDTLKKQNDALYLELQKTHNLTEETLSSIRVIFNRSGYSGQGNPAITQHHMTRQACEEKLASQGIRYENPQYEAICGSKYMAPLYNPETEQPEDATACIDQFEFPNIPCAYPVVWVRASEAAEICHAMGKRLCDTHEWEGACAGALLPADYRFDLAAGMPVDQAIRAMRKAHNDKHAPTKTWAFGSSDRKGICGCASTKSPQCEGGSWTKCGSNTYPAGAFPDCKSTLDVYDLHGNAAEHRNLPIREDQMASRGSLELGYTEMKGSWFIFDTYKAHEDWCRWRAPFWHGTRVMDTHSHHNYHLGFRCCKTID